MQQLESTRSERQQVSEGLSSSQEAVARLTGTLQTVSDARDRLEAQVASTKVPFWIVHKPTPKCTPSHIMQPNQETPVW